MADKTPAPAAAPYDIQVEQALLGAMLVDNRNIDPAAAAIEAEHFFDPLHARIFDAIVYLITEGEVTPLVVHSAIKSDPGMVEVGGLQYLHGIALSAPAMPNIDGFCRILTDFAARRALLAIAETLATDAGSDRITLSAQEIASRAGDALLEIGAATAKRRRTPFEIASDTVARLERAAQGHPLPFVKTGWEKLDDEFGGLRGGDLTVILGKSGMGKAQPVETPVLMADGTWRPIGGLAVGDALASVDGHPSIVTGVFRRGELETYRTTFSDGRSTTVAGDHLWEIRHTNNYGWAGIETTDWIANRIKKKTYASRIQIPVASGDFGAALDLPLHPYVLGCLLGDGGLTGTQVRLTSADPELVARIQSLLPKETEIGRVVGSHAYSIRAVPGFYKGKFGASRPPNHAKAALMAMGLMGLGSAEKFVPGPYLRASRGQRLELLRGLLDTDGWAEKHGTVRFCSTSRALAEDVCYLVRSLGGLCSLASRQTKCNGKNGKPSFVCRIRHMAAETLFALERKSSRAKRGRNGISLHFKSIEAAGKAECVCISVSHPRHLYITDDFIVTHNSALMGGLALNTARAGTPTLVFSLEMTEDQWVERMVCDLEFEGTVKPLWYSRVRNGHLNDGEFARFMLATRQLEGLPIEIIDDASVSMQQITARGRAFKAKHKGKLGVVIIDYLQIVEPADSRDNRERQVNAIARGAKALAKMLGWPVVAGSQMNEGDTARGKEERRPQPSDARESKGIQHEADLMLAPYRPAYWVEIRKPLDTPLGAPEWTKWMADLKAVAHRFELLTLKNRHGRKKDFELWAEMGASAIRSHEPSRSAVEEELTRDLLEGFS